MKEQAISMRELYNHPDVIHRRQTLQTEINKDKVNIDFKVFQNTPEEKEQIKIAKRKYKWSVK